MILHRNLSAHELGREEVSTFFPPSLYVLSSLQRCVPRETRFLAWQPESIYTNPYKKRVWGIGAVERQPQSSGRSSSNSGLDEFLVLGSAIQYT